MPIPNKFNIGGLYISHVEHILFDAPDIFYSDYLGKVPEHTPFVVLDLEFFSKRCIKILTTEGMIGFIKLFERDETNQIYELKQ